MAYRRLRFAKEDRDLILIGLRTPEWKGTQIAEEARARSEAAVGDGEGNNALQIKGY